VQADYSIAWRAVFAAHLLTTIVALSMTAATRHRVLGPLREEVKRLRNEVGEVVIEDPKKISRDSS
jgi:hypothetical protein